MTRFARLALCAVLLLAAPSCARTVYTNLHPQTPVPAVPPAPDSAKPQAWRHFFLFGWVVTNSAAVYVAIW